MQEALLWSRPLHFSHGLKAFFADKRNWGPAAASGLGIAAVISMATGNPELAAGFGIGAMAAGGTSAAVMTYKDALNSGWTKGQAIAGAIGVAGSITFCPPMTVLALISGLPPLTSNVTV